MGPDTPCALVQDATTFRQRHIVSTLGSVGMEAKRHGFASPCIIVVGRVVSLSEKLYASKDQALKGMSVLITRPDHLAFETASLFASKGARAVIYPLIEISPLSFSIPDIAAYGTFIFTSQNAVTLFLDRLFSEGKDARAFSGVEILCIGPKTRETLKSYGIVADGMAQEFRAEGIVELLEGRDLAGKKVCLPRAKGARPYLVEALQEKGAHVDEIFVYETVLPEGASADGFLKALEGIDTAVFTSPSGIKHAVELLKGEAAILSSKRLVAIGPVTAQAMEGYGLKPELVAREYTDDGIIKVLLGETP
jgi:uroporphyrinogen III methyltransferase/synthase